jgi:hypothetical protein
MKYASRFLIMFLGLTLIGAPLQAFAQTADPSAVTNEILNQEPEIPKQEIPDSYLVEADQFFKYCQAEPSYNKYFNCECMAAQFLDERIKVGPQKSRSGIVQAIGKGCADATNAAGSYYQMCLGSGSLLPDNIPAEEYCSCYANKFAQLYEQSGQKPSSKIFVQIQTAAHMQCRRRF